MVDSRAKKLQRTRRHHRIRRKIDGTPERLRLVVFRSLRKIYVQLVDDTAAKTILAAGSDSKELKDAPKATKTDAAKAVGKLIAQKALAAGIREVAFDRAGYKFHGRVKALAQAAREAGLKF